MKHIGTAPLGVKTIWVNGVPWPLTWPSVTTWQVTLPLVPGTNALSVVGVDIHGQPVAGATNSVTAVYNAHPPSPAGQIAINEIMYSPLLPGAEYVELYNTSTSFAFDMSGWQFDGLSYTFPPGSLIGPNSFLVLAADRDAYVTAYGMANLVFDTFAGTLPTDTGTLSLVAPGTNAASNLFVSRVRYSAAPPWPTNASATGGSSSSSTRTRTPRASAIGPSATSTLGWPLHSGPMSVPAYPPLPPASISTSVRLVTSMWMMSAWLAAMART